MRTVRDGRGWGVVGVGLTLINGPLDVLAVCRDGHQPHFDRPNWNLARLDSSHSAVIG